MIDGRRIWRCFHPARYAASALLPDIMRTLDQRPCLFTNGDNFLTMELQELIPGYPPGAQYEVYFNVAQRGAGKVGSTLKAPTYEMRMPITIPISSRRTIASRGGGCC
ncbi:hypothetical protein [Xanthomonas citri]|uniref:hypothetical protein n=1 Tax=Xanthomonas citri TaxID=346 RepID=UPI001F36CD73|nr:hypothetical protein [Xanthomonas citri]